MKDSKDYWIECISLGAEECGLTLTTEQLQALAESVEGGHDNYGMAFYSPPSSDRYDDIEREWKRKLTDKEQEFERYRRNSETAVRRALKYPSDSVLSIGEYGSVFSHGGRTEQVL